MTTLKPLKGNWLNILGLVALPILTVGCGSSSTAKTTPLPPISQSWTMPGAWKVNVTVTSDIYGGGKAVGNFVNMHATMAMVDCSTFPYFGVIVGGGATCYAIGPLAIDSSTGSLFGQPEEIAIEISSNGTMQNGQSIPTVAVFTESNLSGAAAQFDLSGMALNGTINGTWECDNGMTACGGTAGQFYAWKVQP